MDDNSSSKGIKAFKVNTRMVYSLPACGMWHAGLEMVTRIMKMPKSMTVFNFDNISNKIRDSAMFIADLSMNNVANEMLMERGKVEDIDQ